MKLHFKYENLRIDGTRLRTKWDYLLRIVGDFTIATNDHRLYQEYDFPLVEFAVQLHDWIRDVAMKSKAKDFRYKSMESEEPWLVCFRKIDGAWKIEGAQQEDGQSASFSSEEITSAGQTFIEMLRMDAHEKLGVDLSHILKQS